MSKRFWALCALMCVFSGHVFAATIECALAPPTVRLRAEVAPHGDGVARISGARNEVESFQLAITARGGALDKVNAAVAPGEAAAWLTLYRVVDIPVRHSAPRATEPPGMIPDALVPLINPYIGNAIAEAQWDDEGVRGAMFGGAPFTIWENQREVVWVDVTIPVDASAGVHTATLIITADGAETRHVPVEITVWDFALPMGPTHENHFGGVSGVAPYLGMDAESPEFQVIEERYCAMLADHRINPPIPHYLLPKAGDDGAITIDDATDDALSAFVEKYHVTNVDVPRAPFGDILGENRAKALAFYRSWYDYVTKKGWAARSYLYMLDEPNTPEQYDEVRALGALVHEAAPELRCLVVEQTYTHDPAWGTLDEAIDIWCPLFGFVDEASVARVKAEGDDVWSYTALVQPAPPYHPEYETVKGENPPYWELDFPVTAYRVAPWLNRRYGITGLLYWSVVYWGSPDRNPWHDPGFRIRWNGEGALLYPGKEVGVDGPIASIRLKNLRDGMEDYEYFALLEARGGTELVEATVHEAVPTWGSWKQGAEVLPTLRARLAEALTTAL